MPRRTRRPAGLPPTARPALRAPQACEDNPEDYVQSLLRLVLFSLDTLQAQYSESGHLQGLRGPGRNFSRTWVLDKLAPELLSSLLSPLSTP